MWFLSTRKQNVSLLLIFYSEWARAHWMITWMPLGFDAMWEFDVNLYRMSNCIVGVVWELPIDNTDVCICTSFIHVKLIDWTVFHFDVNETCKSLIKYTMWFNRVRPERLCEFEATALNISVSKVHKWCQRKSWDKNVIEIIHLVFTLYIYFEIWLSN